MAKGFFGATPKEISRMKKEVYKDCGLGKMKKMEKKKRKRR
jgi:hypothetical protein